MIRALTLLVCLLLPVTSQAHTLGIDKGTLTEKADGSYHLVSIVPPQFQGFVTTIHLPERCELTNDRRGDRGSYEVRWIFSCAEPLTADDSIELPWRREGVMMTVHWRGAEPVTRFAGKEGGVITLALADYLAGSGGFARAAKRYTILGFEHILEGIDHLLFVLALLFVVRSGLKLVQTITAFTVAHSITLGLATLGYINMPSAPVESAIALSIVFLCVEIVHYQRGRTSLTFSYPWVVAFAFGLLHGLGFAGALSEIGLPPAEIPIALLFFNIGVELGQLVFVFAVVLLLLGVQRLFGLAREGLVLRRAELATVYGIGVLSSYWLIERFLSIFPAFAA